MRQSPNLAGVFELEGNPVPFRDMPIGQFFMVTEEQVNHYWRTPVHNWQSYLSSIVYRKESESIVQRLMTQFPIPLEPIGNEDQIVYPVRFNCSGSQKSHSQQPASTPDQGKE